MGIEFGYSFNACLVEMARSKSTPPVSFDVGFTVNRQGRPALDCQFSVPRILGTVASLTADVSISSFVAHSFNLRYDLPGVFSSGWRLTAEAVKQVNDYQYSSSFSESVEGFGLGWSKGNHRIGLDAHLRDIHPLVTLAGSRLVASEQLRRVPLRTIKTGLNYKYALDRRIFDSPSSGHIVGGHKLALHADVSGLLGDVRMSKLETSLSVHRRVWRSLVWNSRIGAGAIAHLFRGALTTPIQDRFFLGGTNEEASALRGFAYRSVGPCGRRMVVGQVRKGDKLYDHLGGDAFVSVDNSLTFPLYQRDGIDVRAMVFAQAGSLVPTLNSQRIFSDLWNGVRVSVGAGIVVPVGAVGTVELTLGRVVGGALATDTPQLLQVGIRLSNRS